MEEGGEVVFKERTTPGSPIGRATLPPKGKSWYVDVFWRGTPVFWSGRWGTEKFPRPMSVETYTNGLEGERRTVTFVGKKKIHGETAWIYKVDGGGLETWPEEEDGRRGRGDREAQVDQEGFITGWINFVYLAAPSPLEQLLAPHLSTDANDWSLL